MIVTVEIKNSTYKSGGDKMHSKQYHKNFCEKEEIIKVQSLLAVFSEN